MSKALNTVAAVTMLGAEGKILFAIVLRVTGEGTVRRFTVRGIRAINARPSAKRGQSCLRRESWRYLSFHYSGPTVRTQHLPSGSEYHREQGGCRGRLAG